MDWKEVSRIVSGQKVVSIRAAMIETVVKYDYSEMYAAGMSLYGLNRLRFGQGAATGGLSIGYDAWAAMVPRDDVIEMLDRMAELDV